MTAIRIVVSVLLASLPGLAWSQASVSLRDTFEARSGLLELRHVARVHADPEQRDLLEDLAIGPAPALGQIREVERAELARWVQTSAARDIKISWHGADRVRVTRASASPHDDATLADLAKGALTDALKRRFENFSLESAGTPLPDTFPAVRYSMRARPVVLSEFVPKRLVAWVELWEDKRFYRAVPVAFNVSIMAHVLRTRGNVEIGDLLTPLTLIPELMDVTTLPGAFWPAEDSLDGMRVRTAISSGKVLQRGHVEDRPLIARGEMVAVRVSVGTVVIESRGRAMQDGAPARLIQVIPVNAKEPIQARVVAAGLVEVVHP